MPRVGEMLKKKTVQYSHMIHLARMPFWGEGEGGGIIIRLHHQLLFKKGAHGRTLDLHIFFIEMYMYPVHFTPGK